jgi:conjugative transfer signal peptidase TraF
LAAQAADLFMMTRSATLITMSIAIVAQALSVWTKPAPRLLWNVSASVPIGFYSVEPNSELAVTNLVVAMPPKSLATVLADRGYLPIGVPLIKRILALRGQSVCRNDLAIGVDGIEMGMALVHDRQGRQLPVWHGCRVITQDEVFLMNWDEPASFDGRYFGPISLRAVIGRAKPLWTFDKPWSWGVPPERASGHTPKASSKATRNSAFLYSIPAHLDRSERPWTS